MSLDYKSAGVDKEAGYDTVERIKRYAGATHNARVLGQIGAFGAFYDLSGYRHPILVSGTDGVGTKLKLAFALDVHDTIGIDLVAMSVNDILVQGAEPLFFLDYFACGHLDVDVAAAVVAGVATGCEQSGCALLGGETAEMPGMYPDGEYDVAGFAVGVVERSQIIDGSRVQVGDRLLGLASSGPHSNGYSLVRHVLLEQAGWSLERHIDELGRTLGEELLEPTKVYALDVLALIREVQCHAFSHITGGGLANNLARVIPGGMQARLSRSSWTPPAIFTLVQETGGISGADLEATLNMGVGMVVVLPQEQADAALRVLAGRGVTGWVLGEIVTADGPGSALLA